MVVVDEVEAEPEVEDETESGLVIGVDHAFEIELIDGIVDVPFDEMQVATRKTNCIKKPA